jgi:hypothetical protein
VHFWKKFRDIISIFVFVKTFLTNSAKIVFKIAQAFDAKNRQNLKNL